MNIKDILSDTTSNPTKLQQLSTITQKINTLLTNFNGDLLEFATNNRCKTTIARNEMTIFLLMLDKFNLVEFVELVNIDKDNHPSWNRYIFKLNAPLTVHSNTVTHISIWPNLYNELTIWFQLGTDPKTTAISEVSKVQHWSFLSNGVEFV